MFINYRVPGEYFAKLKREMKGFEKKFVKDLKRNLFHKYFFLFCNLLLILKDVILNNIIILFAIYIVIKEYVDFFVYLIKLCSYNLLGFVVMIVILLFDYLTFVFFALFLLHYNMFEI